MAKPTHFLRMLFSCTIKHYRNREDPHFLYNGRNKNTTGTIDIQYNQSSLEMIDIGDNVFPFPSLTVLNG